MVRRIGRREGGTMTAVTDLSAPENLRVRLLFQFGEKSLASLLTR
jgi:hypothetical protein